MHQSGFILPNDTFRLCPKRAKKIRSEGETWGQCTLSYPSLWLWVNKDVWVCVAPTNPLCRYLALESCQWCVTGSLGGGSIHSSSVSIAVVSLSCWQLCTFQLGSHLLHEQEACSLILACHQVLSAGLPHLRWTWTLCFRFWHQYVGLILTFGKHGV